MTQRPTAKDIVDGVVQALYGAQEPLDESLVLVPSNFEVYVHPEAYQELLPLLPRIEAQVQKKLDAELERLNQRHSRRLPNNRNSGGHGASSGVRGLRRAAAPSLECTARWIATP